MRGLSDAVGSWNTTWMCRRMFLELLAAPSSIDRPRYSTSPLVGVVRPSRVLTSVDLPEPLSPTMPSTSPLRA